MQNNWRKTGIAPKGYIVLPPDGKFGWIVLIGCCVCGIAAAAVTIVFGVLLKELIYMLNTNTATISWALAIMSGGGSILGPVVTIVIDTYSCRTSVMVGGMITSIGLILSSYVDRVELLLVTYGVLTGVGNALVYTPLQVTISLYFQKYLGIALGVLTASYATSRLILTPLVQLLLEEYGSRGTLLIMGGFMLHVCVGATVLQPAQWHSRLVPIKEVTNGTKLAEDATDKISSKLLVIEAAIKKPNNPILPATKIATAKERIPVHESRPRTNSELKPPFNDYDYEHRRFSNVSLHLASSLDIFGATNTEAFNKFTNENKGCRSWFKNVLFKSIDHTLLKERSFYLVATQNTLMIGVMVYVTMYVLRFGVEAGLQPIQSAGLVSTRAFGEIAGRLTAPLILTALKLHTRYAYIVCTFLHGISLIVLVYMKTFTSLYALGGLSGLSCGAAIGLSGLLIVETMGVKRLPSVLGLSAFFQGFFILAVGPIIGYLRDATGAFSYCLLFLAILQLIISLIWILKPFITRTGESQSN